MIPPLPDPDVYDQWGWISYSPRLTTAYGQLCADSVIQKPFGYIVRASLHSDKGSHHIYRQRVFISAHDQEQCYKQWMELHADRLTSFNGIWWEVTKHTVYELLEK